MLNFETIQTKNQSLTPISNSKPTRVSFVLEGRSNGPMQVRLVYGINVIRAKSKTSEGNRYVQLPSRQPNVK